ncbi:MAG: hypothetical protein IJM97_03570 [Clostridia bacterium]|nr:hypothetical protein [Clostridia bacterium]
MNKKIIKNIIMVIASALLLLAATLAWFVTIDTASVGEIKTSIDKVEVDYELFDGENWVNIDSQTTTTGKLIPGKEYRYRAIVTAPETKNVLGYTVSLEGITIEGGEEGQDLRAFTYVKSYIGDEKNDAPPTNLDDYDYASYIGADSTDVTIIKVGSFGTADDGDDNGSGDNTDEGNTEPEYVIEKGKKVTIYYSLMLEGKDIAEHNKVSNAKMDIGKVNIIMMYDDATTNETPETETTTEA